MRLFKDIKVKQCFEYNGKLYWKVQDELHFNSPNAVELGSAALLSFDDDQEVKFIDGIIWIV